MFTLQTSPGKMHDEQVTTNISLVGQLLRAQFPQWADLPIKTVKSDGTDNAIFRLGNDMTVRLPLIYWATEQVHKEHQWLPRLAPFLPLAIPVPLVKGKPGAGYPWHWSIYRWLAGEDAIIDKMADPRQAALDLAHFISALQQLDTTGAPTDSSRGEPLANRDQQTRAAIATLQEMYDSNLLLAVWETAVNAPPWHKPPVWIHGDLKPGNLLAAGGKLSAVIDFGGLGVGDPACDVMTAWLFLSANTREIFRAALQIDDATWARARGWALSVAVIALPYYQSSNPGFAQVARRTIDETLIDFCTSG